MPSQRTPFCASNLRSRITSAVLSVLVSTSLFTTVLAGFDGLADKASTVAVDSSRLVAARG